MKGNEKKWNSGFHRLYFSQPLCKHFLPTKQSIKSGFYPGCFCLFCTWGIFWFLCCITWKSIIMFMSRRFHVVGSFGRSVQIFRMTKTAVRFAWTFYTTIFLNCLLHQSALSFSLHTANLFLLKTACWQKDISIPARLERLPHYLPPCKYLILWNLQRNVGLFPA